MRGVPRERRAISATALGASSAHAEQPGRAAQDPLELVGLVEVEVGGEAEPVAQRPGQQPGPRRGADEGERRAGPAGSPWRPAPCRRRRRPGSPPSRGRASPRRAAPSGGSRRGRAPRPRPGEDRMAARSPACWIAGPLVIRSGGAHLGGDDHRQRRLAEPGRPGQQHVVGRLRRGAWPPRARGPAGRARRAGRRTRRGCAGRSAASTARSSASARRRRPAPPDRRPAGAHSEPGPRCRSAARQRRRARRSRRRLAARPRRRRRRSACLADQPSPTRASTTWSRQAGDRRGARRGRRRGRRRADPVASARGRCAGRPCGRCPGTCVSAVRSSLGDGRPQRRRACAPRASPGPGAGRPRETVWSSLEHVPLVVVGEAEQRQGVLADDEATWRASPSSPGRRPASVAGVHWTSEPDAADLDHGAVQADRERPARVATRSSDLREPRRRCANT